MGARGPNREDLVATADNEDRFAVHLTREHRPVGDLVDGNALREVGTAGRILCSSHGCLRLDEKQRPTHPARLSGLVKASMCWKSEAGMACVSA